MFKGRTSYLLILLAFMILAIVVFRCGLAPDKVFSGSDANIGMLTVAQRQFPSRFFGAYGPSPLMGNAGKAPVNLSNVGKTIFSPEIFSNTWYSFYLILSSMALIAYLRLWAIRWLPALFGALSAFWVGSITLAAAGHLYKLGVMALFTLSLYCLELAIRARSSKRALGLSALTGIFVGLMLLEQQDVGLFAGLFLGGYGLYRAVEVYKSDWKRWVLTFLPLVIIGLGLSVGTALKAYDQNVTQANLKADPDQKWNFITQWSMVPAELPDLIAPGYTGWKTGAATGPYWGRVGQSAEWEDTGKGFRNFRLDSLYLGIIPVILALLGFFVSIRRKGDRVFLFWGVMALAALLLSFGKYSPVYRLFYELPLVGNIRAPIKFLHNFQIMVGILAAFGLNRLIDLQDEGKTGLGKGLMLGAGVLAVLMLIFSMTPDGFSFKSEFSEWGKLATVITENISRAWMHATLLSLILSATGWAIWKKKQVVMQVLMVVLISTIVFDSIYLTSHYFNAVDLGRMKKGNVVINYLVENQGDERVCFIEQNGVYNSWLGLDAMYHGINTFNIWQMPRMPDDYKELLGTVGRNQIRLWQIASVKLLTAPVGILQQFAQNPPLGSMFEPVMFYRFLMRNDELHVLPLEKPSQQGDQVLLRFKAHVPRFALFTDWDFVPIDEHCTQLVAHRFNPLKTVLVDREVAGIQSEGRFRKVDATTSYRDAVIHTREDQSGILQFTQRYAPGWSVTVDGEPADLLRCNFISMGVFLQAGEHEIIFKYN